MKKAIFGLATSEEQARRIVDRLLSSGFSNEDISVLFSEQNRTSVRNVPPVNTDYDATSRTVKKGSGITFEKHTKAPEGGVTGATTGGIIGGSLGLLAGIGALAIPGLGAFVAAGPLMATLSGTAVGGGVGLIVGALIGSDIPEYEATQYEAGLKHGNILLSVHADREEEIKRAHEIFKKEGAKDISCTKEKSKMGF